MADSPSSDSQDSTISADEIRTQRQYLAEYLGVDPRDVTVTVRVPAEHLTIVVGLTDAEINAERAERNAEEWRGMVTGMLAALEAADSADTHTETCAACREDDAPLCPAYWSIRAESRRLRAVAIEQAKGGAA